MGMTCDGQLDTMLGNAESHSAISEPSVNDNVSQGPQALNKPSTTQTESKKNSKAKKHNMPNKKQINSDNNDTLIAQKYYISSLENKVNHLENIVTVLQKSLENKNSTDNVHSSSDRAQFSHQSYMDEVKVRMLENRMQIIENQTLMLNNLYVQNQTQMAFREGQLLMNPQIPIVQNGPFPPGYGHSHPFGHPPPPYGYFASQPIYQQQFYQQPHGMFQPVQPMIHVPVPVVNQGSQYLQTRIPVSVIQSDSNTPSSAPAPHSTARAKTQEQGPTKNDNVYHRRAHYGKGRKRKDLNNQNASDIPTKISIQPELYSHQMENDRPEHLNSPSDKHSGINHSSSGHSDTVSCDEHQNSQASNLNLQSSKVNQPGTSNDIIVLDTSFKDSDTSSNGQIVNEEGATGVDQKINKDNFLWIPSLKVPPDVESLEKEMCTQITRL